MGAQCRCGTDVQFSFNHLGCIECGAACCPALLVRARIRQLLLGLRRDPAGAALGRARPDRPIPTPSRRRRRARHGRRAPIAPREASRWSPRERRSAGCCRTSRISSPAASTRRSTPRSPSSAGMKSIYLSGYSLAMLNGWPDMGLLTMTEVTKAASMVASAVDVPIIADADDGYGNALSHDAHGAGVREDRCRGHPPRGPALPEALRPHRGQDHRVARGSARASTGPPSPSATASTATS